MTGHSDTPESREVCSTLITTTTQQESRTSGPQRAHNACTTRFSSHRQIHRQTMWMIVLYCSFWDNLAVFFLLCCASVVLLGMHKSSVATISSRTPAFLSKSPSFDEVAVLMKVAFSKSAAGFGSPLTLAVFYLCPFSAGTAVLAEEELDWLQSGVPVPQTGRPLFSKRQGRLLHKFHLHAPRATAPTLAGFPGSPDYCAHDARSGRQCERTVMRCLCRRRPRVRWMWDAAVNDAPVQIQHCMNSLIKRRFMRRVAKRTKPAVSGCPLRHSGTLSVLNIWQRLRKAVSADPSSTGTRLRWANL